MSMSTSSKRVLMFVFLLSEPPDIRNWFRDYVYESPVLDTSDDFRDILSMERESNEDKFAVEDNNREEQDEKRVEFSLILL